VSLKVLEPGPNTVNTFSVLRASGRRTRPWLRGVLWILTAVLAIGICLLLAGGDLLIATDPLPDHVDAAVVLQGSVLGEDARLAGAVPLLRQGTARRILLSVPKESYWGQPVAPLAYGYINNRYGQEIADRVDFCETDLEVNSTQQEARMLAGCIREHGWHSVAVVTSDYHTRRAGIIWRRLLRQEDPSLHLWMHGVEDPEFNATGWWRERLSAKTWVGEFTKLLWLLVELIRQDFQAV
jgi:uncharacterized SAM-binding protein YcdF (DUF218 family)